MFPSRLSSSTGIRGSFAISFRYFLSDSEVCGRRGSLSSSIVLLESAHHSIDVEQVFDVDGPFTTPMFPLWCKECNHETVTRKSRLERRSFLCPHAADGRFASAADAGRAGSSFRV